MEFMSRGTRPNQTGAQPAGATAPINNPGAHTPGGGSKRGRFSLWGVATAVLAFSVAILILAVASFVVFGKPDTEARNVDKSKLQAVFLNGGQVYFGNVRGINSQYMKLNNIYYLRVNQTVQPNQSQNQSTNDVSLVKLGCELHGPTDSMVINREQIIFWENLKSDGQVAKAVSEYQKQNPKGQQCTQASTQNSTNSTTTTPTSTTPTTTTPTTTTPSTTTKKP